MIQRVTGFSPPTCPWRAYYDPLVREVVEIWWAEAKGNLGIVLGADPPAILVDALGVFKRAFDATQGEDEKLAAEARKAAHEARMARGRRG